MSSSIVYTKNKDVLERGILMDIEKNKPSVPHLYENLKKNHETSDDEMHLIIKETKKIIAKNKEVIEKNRKILWK
jgi:hypothetical protein